ncbi:DUF72 domain-containing protein [Candidatus Protochlamydia phocaeensis]|uniref:DUF72 domain-containing protein n=1 Tax=Candidatus Protochlamydia phocaeensis TaxID=1414722 RepID=UPI000838A59E|nr:DUF72 domain-containing protein [Candidatus Protochlamydia phocaeensis]
MPDKRELPPHIQIGTSGWHYAHWKAVFYPSNVRWQESLRFYANHFKTVEVNSTFYRLPAATALQNWIEQVPNDFIFSVKASQFITHSKKLKDAAESTARFFDSIRPLRKQLGPLLFQLPFAFKKNAERLEEFVRSLAEPFTYAFEFRHPSWFADDIYEILHTRRLALCISEINGQCTPKEVTVPFTYIRLHGPHKAYQGSYSAQELEKWQHQIAQWASHLTVYCYFDNDEKGYAIKDALRLKKMLLKEL